CVIRGGATLDMGGISLRVHETKVYHCSHLMTAGDAPVYTNTATVNAVAASASVNGGAPVQGNASVNASSSVAAAPASASVKANVANVLGAQKVIAHHAKKAAKAHKAPKKIVKRAKPAAPKVKAATFTG